jgi:hypothetical protein
MATIKAKDTIQFVNWCSGSVEVGVSCEPATVGA